jgi:hypothetical protein
LLGITVDDEDWHHGDIVDHRPSSKCRFSGVTGVSAARAVNNLRSYHIQRIDFDSALKDLKF